MGYLLWRKKKKRTLWKGRKEPETFFCESPVTLKTLQLALGKGIRKECVRIRNSPGKLESDKTPEIMTTFPPVPSNKVWSPLWLHLFVTFCPDLMVWFSYQLMIILFPTPRPCLSHIVWPAFFPLFFLNQFYITLRINSSSIFKEIHASSSLLK